MYTDKTYSNHISTIDNIETFIVEALDIEDQRIRYPKEEGYIFEIRRGTFIKWFSLETEGMCRAWVKLIQLADLENKKEKYELNVFS